MSRAYYNEIDPHAAAWLRELINAGHIAPGDVDTRSIEDVTPNELRGYTQCHFFAGIGGWAYALDLAGWSRDRPVWTGSCPCQPFSAAGKGAGFEDERHLWPAWQHLIAQCRPSVVFGEQVASKHADAWIDLVQADLEGMGYAFGCIPFPAAGIGAPHIRDRNYWLGVGQADANGPRSQGRRGVSERPAERPAWPSSLVGGEACKLCGHPVSGHDRQYGCAEDYCDCELAHAASGGRREERADSGRVFVGNCTQGLAAGFEHGGGDNRPAPVNGHWRASDWLLCRDEKWRPVEPGSFPLAHGLPVGMGKLSPRLRELASVAGLDRTSLKAAKSFRTVQLRGYGNAIVPQQAAEFVKAFVVEEAAGTVNQEQAA